MTYIIVVEKHQDIKNLQKGVKSWISNILFIYERLKMSIALKISLFKRREIADKKFTMVSFLRALELW